MSTARAAAIEPLMSIKDVANILNAGRRTIERLIASGEFPRADLYIGKLPRWKRETVTTWINNQGDRR